MLDLSLIVVTEANINFGNSAESPPPVSYDFRPGFPSNLSPTLPLYASADFATERSGFLENYPRGIISFYETVNGLRLSKEEGRNGHTRVPRMTE